MTTVKKTNRVIMKYKYSIGETVYGIYDNHYERKRNGHSCLELEPDYKIIPFVVDYVGGHFFQEAGGLMAISLPSYGFSNPDGTPNMQYGTYQFSEDKVFQTEEKAQKFISKMKKEWKKKTNETRNIETPESTTKE